MPTTAGRFVRRYLNAVARRAADPLAYLPRRPRNAGTPPAAGVVGYFGWGNYGDELFLEVFREHLAPAMRLRTVLDPVASDERRTGRAVRATDFMLIGGGDIVIPWTSRSRYWDPRFLRRPVFVAGVGVPTWRAPTPRGIATLRRFFQHRRVQFIGSRDVESSTWIRETLEPEAPVATSPDLVWALSLPPATRISDPPVFGVSVRSRKSPDDLTQVRHLCERAMALGYRVRRIVLATGQTRLRDLEATEALGLPDTELVTSEDLSVISRAIGECSAMASMKFHGLVVATMYGVPCIVLMPTAKNRHLIKEIGRPDLLSAFTDRELAERVTADPQPIDPGVRERMRSDAVTFLADLRSRMLASVASG
jgi:polysaccharide pyruvyl transferase WcaK-like protein